MAVAAAAGGGTARGGQEPGVPVGRRRVPAAEPERRSGTTEPGASGRAEDLRAPAAGSWGGSHGHPWPEKEVGPSGPRRHSCCTSRQHHGKGGHTVTSARGDLQPPGGERACCLLPCCTPVSGSQQAPEPQHGPAPHGRLTTC